MSNYLDSVRAKRLEVAGAGSVRAKWLEAGEAGP